MNATTKLSIQCHLASGETATLTAEDCASILNALARRRMLTVLVEDIPADYEEVMSEECCAWTVGCDEHDEEIVLSVHAADYVSATPRKKQATKKKAAKKSSR